MKTYVSSAKEFGGVVRRVRKSQGLTQQQLALTANTAPRFISDLENGKPTCQMDKALQVARCLGLNIELSDGV
jgi:y4mF family transcriptional regulator